MINRRRACVLLSVAPLAAASPARAQATAGPAAPIVALNNALLASMRAGKATPFPQRVAALAPVVQRTFDLPAILRSSVGPRFDSLPADQKARLQSVFDRFTVARYASNFDTDSGDRFEVLPDTRAAGADTVVQTRILPASGSPARIDYVMRRTADGWRAVDVLLDGTISQAAVTRSDFRSLLSSNDAGPLIASLSRKIADLSGGTLAP